MLELFLQLSCEQVIRNLASTIELHAIRILGRTKNCAIIQVQVLGALSRTAADSHHTSIVLLEVIKKKFGEIKVAEMVGTPLD